jgi:bifunctional non-homologous end joining protein LigD
MQASSVKEPFDSPDWIFETKLNGYRAIAVIDSTGKTRIWSRNRLPLEPKFPTVGDAVNKLKLRSTILDGEIVALDRDGIPRFQLLQHWQKRPPAPVVFFLFDLLWCDGRDLTTKTVVQRRKRLEEIITQVSGIQVGGYIENRGKALFKADLRKLNISGSAASMEYRDDITAIRSRPEKEAVSLPICVDVEPP